MNNYNVKYKSGSVVFDISDYVHDIKDVPFMIRNPDYTLIFDGYDITVSSAYTNITNIEENTQVFVYSGSTLIHNGRVEEKTYDWDKRTYKLKIQHALKDLDKMENSRRKLNSFIAPLTQSVTVNTQTNYLIKHNDLITAHFSASGYKLDWSTYYVSTSINLISTKGYNTSANWTHVIPNYRADQLYYVPGAMYNINQPKVWSPLWLEYNNGNITDTSPNTGGAENMLSSLEVVNILSSMYGYNYITKDTGSFYVVATAFDSIDITVPDNEKFTYEEKKYKGETGVSVGFSSLTLWTGIYYTNQSVNRWFPTNTSMQYYTTDTPELNGLENDGASQPVVYNNSYSTGSKAKSLKWYNHLVPVAVVDDLAYLIYPSVVGTDTIIKLQRDSTLSSGTEKTIETFSKNVWSLSHLYQAQEIKFSNLKKDLVKIIWRENN
jgi:hypothetical protein